MIIYKKSIDLPLEETAQINRNVNDIVSHALQLHFYSGLLSLTDEANRPYDPLFPRKFVVFTLRCLFT